MLHQNSKSSKEKKLNHGLKIMFEFAFKSFQEAIYMNGHGVYVWSVVIILIFCLVYAFSYYKIKLKEYKKKLDETY